MLMLSEKMKIIFHWFKQDPSEEYVKAFKKIFPVGKCSNNFYNLLDHYLQNHRNVLENNGKNSVRDLHGD